MFAMGRLNASTEIIPLQGPSGRNDARFKQNFNTKNKPCFPDQLIVPRVKQYLEDHKDTVHVDIDAMVDELQRKYREYGRRKRAGFRQSVEKAFGVVLQQYGIKETEGEGFENTDTSDEDMLSEDMSFEKSNNSSGAAGQLMNMYMSRPGVRRAGGGNATGGADKELINISSDEDGEDGGGGGGGGGGVGGGGGGSKGVIEATGPTRRPTLLPASGQAPLLSGPVPCPTPGLSLLPTPALPFGGPGGPPQNDTLRGKVEGLPPASVAAGMTMAAASNVLAGPPRAEGPPAMSGQRAWVSPAAASTPRQPKRPRPAPQAAAAAASQAGAAAVAVAMARGNSVGPGGRESPVMKRRRFAASWAAGPPLAAEPQEARASFADLGGVDDVLEEVCRLLAHLRRPEAFRALGVAPPRGLLLHGPPGCGKSLLARAVAGELGLPLLRVAGPELVAGVSGESEARIRELFECATNTAPCVLLLDEVDALAPPRQGAQREMERRIVAQLLSCMDELGQTPAGAEVLVLGATSRPEALDAALRRAGRFDREVSLGIPDARAREAILGVLTRCVHLDTNVDLRVLAKRTPGFVGADLQALTREAALAAVTRLLLDERKKLETVEMEKEKVKKEKMKETEKKETEKEKKRKVEEKKDESEVEVKNDSEATEKVGEKNPVEDVKMKDSTTSEEKAVSNPNERDDEPKSKEKAESDKPKDKKEDESMEVIDISDRDTPKDPAVAQNVLSDSKTTAAEEDEVQIEAEVSCSDSIKDKGTPKVIPSSYGDEDEEMEVLEADDEEVVSICETTTINSTTPRTGVWSTHFPALSEEQLQTLNITQEDFESALKHVQPSAKREGFATVPDISWDDVGALRDVREELQMAILAPVRHPEAFESLGLTAPAGLLLCGPPGCGKTLIAKAIANEADINFISVKGPELLNMYVGESEKAVRQCFLRARNSAPCVIFFDELDALCPRRTGGSAGEGSSATQRVVNQLLTEMDGVEGRRGVFLLAASNRPDILDPAVLRPGRLDRVVFVGLPKTDARADILRALTKNGTRPRLAPDVDLQVLGECSTLDGCSGADMAALVREAATLALREHLSAVTDTQTETKEQQPPPCVQMKHLEQAMKRLRPSVSPQERRRYEILRRQFSVPGQELGPVPSLIDLVNPATGEAQIGSTGPNSADMESKQLSPSSSVPIAPIAVPTA